MPYILYIWCISERGIYKYKYDTWAFPDTGAHTHCQNNYKDMNSAATEMLALIISLLIIIAIFLSELCISMILS